MKKAVIITFDAFTDVDVFLPWDLLQRVRRIHKDFSVQLLGTREKHTSITGLEIKTHGSIEEAKGADLVYFASGKSTRTLMKDTAYLHRFSLNPNQQLLCSMCSGALLLAALGHLEGLDATTYPTAFDELKSFGVNVIKDQSLITQGNIATAAGCLAVVDLVGWALEKLYDHPTRATVLASVMPLAQGQACIY